MFVILNHQIYIANTKMLRFGKIPLLQHLSYQGHNNLTTCRIHMEGNILIDYFVC